MKNKYAIVGDIGGTNARFAIAKQGEMGLSHVRIFQCEDYPCMDGAIQDYLASLSTSIPSEDIVQGSFAFACPVHLPTIAMTNNPWRFAKADLKEWLKVKHLKVINDFTAMALCIPHIEEKDLVALTSAEASSQPEAPKLIIGAGTGLGVSALINSGGIWYPLFSEGGHVEFSPIDEEEVGIWRVLASRFGRVSFERILSGEGIVNLYKAMCEIEAREATLQHPSEVTSAAANGDAFCHKVLLKFCDVLGRFAGNAALTFGALGGVYITGGIVPRIMNIMGESQFANSFKSKGRMESMLDKVPCFAITDNYAGLRGVVASLDQPGLEAYVLE